MKSNPNNICIDRDELKKSRATIKMEFFMGLHEIPLTTFVIDTDPDRQDIKHHEQKLANVWCVRGSLLPAFSPVHEAVAANLEQFTGRHTHDSSYPVVIYPDDLGMTDKKTASAAEFMSKIAQNLLAEHLGNETLYLNATSDRTIEKFAFDPNNNTFISVPMFNEQDAVPVKSNDGLWSLDHYISKHVDSNATFLIPDILENTGKILQKAGYTPPTVPTEDDDFTMQKNLILGDPMKNAQELLAFLQTEIDKLPAPPTFRPQKAGL